MKRRIISPVFILLFLLIASLAVLQTWSTLEHTKNVAQINKQLNSIKPDKLKDEKFRQEVIGLRIKNESQRVFWNNLITTIGPLATTFVALLGALLGLRNYLDAKEKDRLENAANDLKDILKHTVDNNHRLRVVGIVGLQHFFTSDKEEYHLRALSSLLATARLEEDDEVRRNIRIAAEQAIKVLDSKTLSQISWQYVKLKDVDFSRQNLKNTDFRDAILEDADFSGCNLQAAQFIATRLNGACFDEADVQYADFTYADLAGVSFVKANLRNATLLHSKVLRMNIQKADLRGANFDIDKMPWPLISGWREATFDDGILEQLLAKHGPAPSGVRILMLMWEIPPLVAGGTWTACYHLVRKLQKRGAHITIVVPWAESIILPNPFGCDVDIIPLGIVPPEYSTSPYGGSSQAWSPYSRAFSPWTPYGHSAYYSPYGSAQAYHSYGTTYSAYSKTAPPVRLKPGSGILRITEEFKRRFVRLARTTEFDVIHAHDWVTFDAARSASEKKKKPWVAHFHSTEFERRPDCVDNVITRIEQEGINSSNKIVTPSKVTADCLLSRYQVTPDKITIVPNSYSLDDVDNENLGRFETQRVVFTGRLAQQKGPELFADIARQFRGTPIRFYMYGAGEMQNNFSEYADNVSLMGELNWQNRQQAFDNASAVIVPSRSEPFGMVILEAMESRVPVFYPKNSGAAEVLDSGIKIDPKETQQISKSIKTCLNDWNKWEDLVEQQAKELDKYTELATESRLLTLWEKLESDAGSYVVNSDTGFKAL